MEKTRIGLWLLLQCLQIILSTASQGVVVRLTAPPFQSSVIRCEFSQGQTRATAARVRFKVADGTIIHEEHSNFPNGWIRLPMAPMKGHINEFYTCEVTFYQEVRSIRRTLLTKSSNATFFGITASPQSLVLKEGSRNFIKISTQVPIFCGQSVQDDQCCLTVQLQLGGSQNNLAVISNCHYDLCRSHWDSTLYEYSIRVPVFGSKDDIDDGDQNVEIRFMPLAPAGKDVSHLIWDGVEIDPVQVKIEDVPEKTCSVTGDPHVNMFNNKLYHFFDVGDFIIYHNPAENFEIHGRTFPCGNRGASCLCGAVIRDNENTVMVDMCRSHRRRRTHARSSVRLRYPYGAVNNRTEVLRSRRVDTIVVTTSGATIKFKGGRNSLNMDLTIPPNFSNNQEGGICGRRDDPSNRYTLRLRNGTLTSCQTNKRCRSTIYSSSWTLGKHESYFENAPPPTVTRTVTNTPTRYCGCFGNTSSLNPTIDCGTRAATPVQKSICSHCSPLPTNVPPDLLGVSWITANKRDVRPNNNLAAILDETYPLFDTYEYNERMAQSAPVGLNKRDDDENWTDADMTNVTVWTEECKKALEQSLLHKECKKYTEVFDAVLESCVLDRAYGGELDVDMITDSVEAYSLQCSDRMQRDPQNFVQSTDPRDEGRLVVKSDLQNSMCDEDCLAHGTCVNGTCQCDSHFIGSACDIDTRMGVTIQSILGSGTCDIGQSCKGILLDVENVEQRERLKCRFLHVHEDGTHTNVLKSDGQLVSRTDLFCPIELTRPINCKNAPVLIWKVSVTMNGRNYGNSFYLTVLDSTCFSS